MGSRASRSHCRRPAQGAPFQRPQEGHRQHQAIHQDVARGLHRHELYNKVGTMGMADYQNYIGGLPVRNFTAGRNQRRVGGRDLQDGRRLYRRVEHVARRASRRTPACPAAPSSAATFYFDAEGKEVASPVEYETPGLLGTNSRHRRPTTWRATKLHCHDLGVDRVGRHAGRRAHGRRLASFGDAAWMVPRRWPKSARDGAGQLWAQGTARAGEHYGVARAGHQEAGDQRHDRAPSRPPA